MGDFGITGMWDANWQDEIILWILFYISSMFLMVIMLNLLIAIMSETFANIIATQNAAIMREKLVMIVENQMLPSRRNWRDVNYIISFSRVTQDKSDREALKEIQQEIKKTKQTLLYTMNSRFDQLSSEISKLKEVSEKKEEEVEVDENAEDV